MTRTSVMATSSGSKQADDSELLYISFAGVVMAAIIATGYHNELDLTITSYAPEGSSYPFPPQTRVPALKLALTVGFFLLLVLLYSVIRRLRRNLIRKLYNYREWLYQPKAMKTKMWMLSLKALLPKKRMLYSLQDVLPKYPLPPLDFTCQRALQTLEPLVTPERFQEIKKEMEKFAAEDGPKLQKILEKKFETEENWVSDIWDKYAYLVGRYPLIYTNFCMGGGVNRSDLASYTKGLPQAAVAANQVYHMTRFYELIKSETLESLMMMNLVPICNDRYRYMFGTTRIPGHKIDSMRTYEESKHIIVFRKGMMFNLPLYASESHGPDSLLTPEELQRQMELILKHTDGNSSVPNPAVFTTLARSDWCKEREKLMMRTQNRDSLQQVERALFHVILEDTSPQNLSEECHANLCGSGFNRWFDKSMTMSIYENGLTGANVEHTSVDATLPSRGLEYMFAKMRFDKDGNAQSPPDIAMHDLLSPPFRIEWNLDESQSESLLHHQTAHLQQSANLDMLVLKLYEGKGSIKKCRVSPDSFMQMSLQLAFYKLHQSVPKTYETAMTRFFKFGRTETIRTVSKHSVAFTEAMIDPKATKEEKLNHLKKAMKHHNDYKLNAMSGRASDRSLFGLMAAARMSGQKQPALFDLPEIKAGDQLSTSQSPFMFDQKISRGMKVYPAGGAFAPQTMDGYSVYYLFLGENHMTIHIGSYRCHPETDSKKFSEALQSSMDEIKTLLTKV